MSTSTLRLMSSQQKRPEHGFTLVEMLIALVIVGILATIGIPSFQSFFANQSIKNASFDFIASLTLTRSEAIKRNALVTSTPTSNDWSLGWTITAADGTVINRRNALKGVSATCKQGSPLSTATCSAITYNNNGRTGNIQAVQFSNTATSEVRCITIDLSGRPSSKKGAC